MAKEIVTDEAILTQPCDAVTADEAQSIADELLATYETLEDAVCLAANQIGITKRAVLYVDESETPRVIFNPKCTRCLGAFKTQEACFSREEESKVTRFAKITVAYEELIDGDLVKRKREFRDWTAQIIQHGIDHCNSKLV
jgi:peptide deformylase